MLLLHELLLLLPLLVPLQHAQCTKSHASEQNTDKQAVCYIALLLGAPFADPPERIAEMARQSAVSACPVPRPNCETRTIDASAIATSDVLQASAAWAE